jgi:hypothetical protein
MPELEINYLLFYCLLGPDSFLVRESGLIKNDAILKNFQAAGEAFPPEITSTPSKHENSLH